MEGTRWDRWTIRDGWTTKRKLEGHNGRLRQMSGRQEDASPLSGPPLAPPSPVGSKPSPAIGCHPGRVHSGQCPHGSRPQPDAARPGKLRPRSSHRLQGGEGEGARVRGKVGTSGECLFCFFWGCLTFRFHIKGVLLGSLRSSRSQVITSRRSIKSGAEHRPAV